ncbi:hypothetical protein [Moraxella lacunata]|uniref:hypothetical protein n=1 Tax=Moraxella lacunata TaxID=477 RepID=UPI003EE40FE0
MVNIRFVGYKFVNNCLNGVIITWKICQNHGKIKEIFRACPSRHLIINTEPICPCFISSSPITPTILWVI